LREGILAAVLERFAPHLVLVDHEPAGLAGELRPALAAQCRRTPRPTLVLGLRDITYGPAETRSHWHDTGAYALLDQVYDAILVYGQRAIFDPIAAYAFSPVAAAKTTFTGYLRPPQPLRPAAQVRAQLATESRPLVVVTAGGGRD